MDTKQITKEEFLAYEKVRQSGVTNMFDVTIVCRLSRLDRDTVFAVMDNYNELAETYLGEEQE